MHAQKDPIYRAGAGWRRTITYVYTSCAVFTRQADHQSEHKLDHEMQQPRLPPKQSSQQLVACHKNSGVGSSSVPSCMRRLAYLGHTLLLLLLLLDYSSILYRCSSLFTTSALSADE
jgi:hypothetical protein